MRLPPSHLVRAIRLLTLALPACCGTLAAQGVTTASIGGTVADTGGLAVEGAEVRVLHRATGVAARTLTRGDGRYIVQGLTAGGPYAVTVRRIGYREQRRDSLFLALGQYRQLDFALAAAPTELSPLGVTAHDDPVFSASHTGAKATVPDVMLRRLPTLDRDLYGLAYVVPHVSTRYGVSGGGVNYRFSGIQLDGATDQAFFASQPAGAIMGGKPISIEAVQEYQVLLSPYDVRYGGFAGALVSGVTRSGTNELHGTAFAYAANEQLARNVEVTRATPFDRAQFGFTLGGPIVRNQMHFYMAAEFQRLRAPSAGPFFGQDPARQPPVPVTTAQVDSFVQILQGYGMTGGTGAAVTNEIPAINLLGRMDLAIGASHRLLMRYNFGRHDSVSFSRPIAPGSQTPCRAPSCFPLSSLLNHRDVLKHSVLAQLSSQLRGGSYNELAVGYTRVRLDITPGINQPLIEVTVPAATGTGSATLEAGSADFATDFELDQHIIELSDNVTVPLGPHRVTLGAAAQLWDVRNFQLRASWGIWNFTSLDSLRAGNASAYRVTFDQGGADATMRGGQVELYAGDQWQASSRLSMTYGLRLAVPFIGGRPPYVYAVDSAFGRRTDVIPSGIAQLSPRLGFNWRVPGAARTQLRGGVGLFTGRPPLAWLLQAFQNHGRGAATLPCGAVTGSLGPPPPFPAQPDYRNPPTTCANGMGLRPTSGNVNFVDATLRFPQTFRATLGFDRELPAGVVATLEGLYTRATHDFQFLNANLKDPIGSDARGRTMYGTLSPQGVATPGLVDSQRVEVTELRNQSRNYSYSVTVQLARRFARGNEIRASYTYARARDVQTDALLVPAAGESWRTHAVSGPQDEERLGISGFDQPHRLLVVGTFSAPWRSWPTDFAVSYVGSPGTPYTYVAGPDAPRRTGDLNADGSSVNDPIYVPTHAGRTGEILFAGSPIEIVAQQVAFERFIEGMPCLREQRGRILARNSCRGPWTHLLNAAIRQGLPALGRHAVAVQVEVFNLLNLLNRDWGLVRLPANSNSPYTTALLTHVGESAGKSVFRFDPNTPRWNSENLNSYYQIQLSARYSF